MQPDSLKPTGDRYIATLKHLMADAEAEERQLALAADGAMLNSFARQIGEQHGASRADVFAALDYMGPNAIPLLRSPLGLTLLGHAVAGLLGSTNTAPFVATVN